MITIKRFLFKTTLNTRYISKIQYLRSTKYEHFQKVPLPQSTVQLYEKYKDSILFSSFIENNKIKLGYKRNQMLKSIVQKQENDRQHVSIHSRPLSVAAQLLENNSEKSNFNTVELNDTKNNKYILEENELKFLSTVYKELNDESFNKVPTNWFTDYETYDEQTISKDGHYFGTPG